MILASMSAVLGRGFLRGALFFRNRRETSQFVEEIEDEDELVHACALTQWSRRDCNALAIGMQVKRLSRPERSS